MSIFFDSNFVGVNPGKCDDYVVEFSRQGAEMMMEKLSAVGLDDKEIKFYLSALELGAAPVTAVANRAGVSRTNGYDLLQRLEKRGLLAQVNGEDGVRQIVPSDPDVLLRDWERTRVMLDDLVPELRSLFNSSPRKPRVKFHEGVEGVERAMWVMLDCRSKVMYGILSMQELMEVPGTTWMAKFIAERVRRGIRLEIVRSRSRETSNVWPGSIEEMRELRYAPSGVDLDMSVYISDDVVTYVSSKYENYALTIESRELASLQKALHQSLWAVSQPTEPEG